MRKLELDRSLFAGVERDGGVGVAGGVVDLEAKPLLVPIFKGGALVYPLPALEQIRSYCAAQVDTLWDEVKRFDNPHKYYVDLSQRLWDIKSRMLSDAGKADRV